MIADIERALLKAIMDDRELYFDVHQRLYDRLFSSPERRKLYHLIVEQYGNGKKVDHSLIKFSFSEDELPEIRKVWLAKPDGYDIDNSLDVLKRSRIERETNELIDALRYEPDPSVKAQKLIDGAVKINEDRDEKQISLDDQFEAFKYDMDRRVWARREGEMMGIPTGLVNFDDFTGGLQPGESMVIGARPGNGKTSLAVQWMKHAERNGVPSLIVSLEMSATQLLTKMACGDLGIDSRKFRSGELSDDDVRAVNDWIGRWERSNPQMYIDDSYDPSIEVLLQRAKKYILTKGVKVIMFDYLQMMKTKARLGSVEEKIAYIVREIKNLALANDVACITLSQLSRSQNRDFSKDRPISSDLKYSGEIEASADIVAMLWYPYANTTPGDEPIHDRNYAELNITKGRNTGVAGFQLYFEPSTQRFTDFNQHERKTILDEAF